MVQVVKTKTRKGKRVLDDRASKTVENDKIALFVKGNKTTEDISEAMKDLYLLKKPLVQKLDRRNPFHPFEDETPLERFSNKYDASMFLFGSNSKKHKNSMIFGRTFDGNLLDMAELLVENYIPAKQFANAKNTLGSKPCIILEGAEFDSDPTLNRIGNILVDFFRGPKIDHVRLQGLETVIVLSTKDETILMRVYRVVLKKSTTTTPRVELEEIGPSIDFKVGRKKLASDSLYKTACRKPKALMSKRRKNMSEDVFGTQLARVHVGKQNTDAIQTRKVKALRKGKPVEETANGQDADSGDGEEMEE